MSDVALVEKLERTLLHVWPSVETEMHGPWALRFAHGYSARANSASALSQDATIDEKLLHRTKTFFDGHKLPAQFRISPLVLAEPVSVLQSDGAQRRCEQAQT
jgi:N-acetylglutamate synthase